MLRLITAGSPPTRASPPPSTPREISSRFLLLGHLTSRLRRSSSSTPMAPPFHRRRCRRRRRPPPRTLRCRLFLSHNLLCITLPPSTRLSITLQPSHPRRPLHRRPHLLLILPSLPRRLPPCLLHLSHRLLLLLLSLLTQPNPYQLKKPPIPGVSPSPPSRSNSRSPRRGPRRWHFWQGGLRPIHGPRMGPRGGWRPRKKGGQGKERSMRGRKWRTSGSIC